MLSIPKPGPDGSPPTAVAVRGAHARAVAQVRQSGEEEGEEEEEEAGEGEESEGGGEADGEEGGAGGEDGAGAGRKAKLRRLHRALRVLEVHLKLRPLPVSTAGNAEIAAIRSALCEIQGAITKAQAQREEAAALQAAATAAGTGALRLHKLMRDSNANLKLGERWEVEAQAANAKAIKADADIDALMQDSENSCSQDEYAEALKTHKLAVTPLVTPVRVGAHG